MAKLKSCFLKYYKQAFSRGVAVDETNLARCRASFSNPATGRGCIEKLDSKDDDCQTFGDGPALRAKVEAHVLDVLNGSCRAAVRVATVARARRCCAFRTSTPAS